ncbi:MAG: hypothetical protein MZV64_22670 [Ignavibacteriales bacterium]|nr:hypothetical protein [Ignavibacteriales bacterium]
MTMPSTASAISNPAKGNWFLIKDSWENAYWGQVKGYFFYQDRLPASQSPDVHGPQGCRQGGPGEVRRPLET